MPPVPIIFAVGAAPNSKHGGAGKFISYKINTNGTLERGPSPPTPPPAPSANQKRKAGISANALAASTSLLPHAAGGKLSTSMTPLNVTIVQRCLARGTEPSSPPGSAARKRTSGNHTPATSPAPTSVALHAVHPYSRASDLANTRSTVPSPQEILRAERAEEEKARQKKENAAAARLAAALARRRKAQRNGSRSASQRVQSASVAPPTMIPATVRAITTASHGRSKSVDPKDEELPTITTEPASSSASPLIRGGTALKRTRSSGIHGINTNLTPGAVSIASPLRSVAHAAEGDDEVKPDASPNSDNSDGPARKRTRLSSVSPRAASTRRANTTSPMASPSALEGETAAAGAAPPTDARSTRRAAPEAAPEPTASAMRRAVSATEGAGRRATTRRTSSVGLEPGAERARREVQMPARMRDYDR